MEGPDGKINRGPSAAAASRAVEFKDAKQEELNQLGAKYREVQMKASGFEKDLHTVDSNMRTRGVNPEMISTYKEVRGEIVYKLEDAKNEKEELERMIKERGGNPSDYTVQ